MTSANLDNVMCFQQNYLLYLLLCQIVYYSTENSCYSVFLLFFSINYLAFFWALRVQAAQGRCCHTSRQCRRQARTAYDCIRKLFVWCVFFQKIYYQLAVRSALLRCHPDRAVHTWCCPSTTFISFENFYLIVSYLKVYTHTNHLWVDYY